MVFLGIDIGSTCAKTVALTDDKPVGQKFIVPTGWSSFEALDRIREELRVRGVDKPDTCVATGYGRAAVPFADQTITEITCHARGAVYLFHRETLNVIDIGGQDTKVISIDNGRVSEFFMNDKCSAGTGKFVEVMASRLGVPISELDTLSQNRTEEIQISSLCTVFAESEVISLAGRGVPRENIAWGVLNSIALKVAGEYARLSESDRPVCLTGGLCDAAGFLELLEHHLKAPVISCPDARYAGAYGAALIAREKYQRSQNTAIRMEGGAS